jgi:hypothetical protein
LKAFRFRLDPALRWRTTQLHLEQERVLQATAHLAAIQKDLLDTHDGLRKASSDLISAGSAAFGSWSAYGDRCRRRILSLEEQLRQAKKALALQTQKMVDAHRGLRVLENLKRGDQNEWTGELNRESEAFAGEAHLARLSRDSRRSGRSS